MIRVATGDDEPGVLDVDDRAKAGDRERRRYLRAAIAEGECVVEEVDERVSGFVIRKPRHFFGRDFVELLFVSSAARRTGVGRALLRAAVAASTTSQVFTSTNRSNTPMRALLDSEEWARSGELVGLDEGDPEIVYYRSRDI
jgi:GNAT superfamily N-acetyltransferase